VQYMLVHAVDDELAAAKPWDAKSQASLEAWLDQTISRGLNLHGSRLRPASDATTVKVRRGELLVTDGPLAETKEQVAGYDLLECSSMEEAVQLAAQHPTAQIGAIEVRPLYGDQPPRGLPEPAPGRRRYMMFVCTGPALDPKEPDQIAPVQPWVEEMGSRGTRRFGSQLDDPARARTVRVRDGRGRPSWPGSARWLPRSQLPVQPGAGRGGRRATRCDDLRSGHLLSARPAGPLCASRPAKGWPRARRPTEPASCPGQRRRCAAAAYFAARQCCEAAGLAASGDVRGRC
jgi:hypothetical protein